MPSPPGPQTPPRRPVTLLPLQVTVEGLEGVTYSDSLAGGQRVAQQGAVVFDREVDRIYLAAPDAAMKVGGGRLYGGGGFAWGCCCCPQGGAPDSNHGTAAAFLGY